jgi:hypothetical protein
MAPAPFYASSSKTWVLEGKVVNGGSGAPALEARPGFRNVLVDTGQHYDAAMSQAFFDEP